MPKVHSARREEARVEAAVGGETRAGASAAERLGDGCHDADFPAAVAVSVPARDLSGVARFDGFERQGRVNPSTISLPETTSRSLQWLVVPTSMYSMKRTTTPVPRKRRASSTTVASFTPRRTTALSSTGARPAASAASMPRRTSVTGTSESLMVRKTCASRESRLTVTRRRPARASSAARRSSSAPFVVKARSQSGIVARSSTRSGRSARSSGSPPVSRSLRTPSPANTRATRAISWMVNSSGFERNRWPSPNAARGMQ